MYVCGTGHVLEYNHVYRNAAYGLHVSCEQGGIRDVVIRHNVVEDHPQRGIQIQGANHVVADNILRRNGMGIGIRGTQIVVARNTITGYLPLADNYGILVDGTGITLDSNRLLGQVVRSFGAQGSRYIFWGMGARPTLTGNTCDVAMEGCPVGGSEPPVPPVVEVPPIVVPVGDCTSVTTSSATGKSYTVSTTVSCP